MNQLHPIIEALRPFLNAWGVARQQEVVDALAAVPGHDLPLDLTPKLIKAQARLDELGHVITMNYLTFELILAHPERASKLANEALKRIERSAAA